MLEVQQVVNEVDRTFGERVTISKREALRLSLRIAALTYQEMSLDAQGMYQKLSRTRDKISILNNGSKWSPTTSPMDPLKGRVIDQG